MNDLIKLELDRKEWLIECLVKFAEALMKEIEELKEKKNYD